MKAPKRENDMYNKRKKEIILGNFTVQGTTNPYTAARVLKRLMSLERYGLKEAKYRISGKTIIIKPLTRKV